MPVRNGADTIAASIGSVLEQTWPHWELLVVDNGSTDGTASELMVFCDPRIRLLEEPQAGVGPARNKGLEAMRGDFFCFLDADDLLPTDSLAARMEPLLRDPSVHFVDGGIEAFNGDGQVLWTRTPSFSGAPLTELMTLRGRCFVGNTWMVRRIAGTTPRFRPEMSHSEDLYFYMTIAHQGRYVALQHPVLRYRVGHRSAMSDLAGQHQGYRDLVQAMRALEPPPSEARITAAWKAGMRVMARTYLRNGSPVRALRAWSEPVPAPSKISA